MTLRLMFLTFSLTASLRTAGEIVVGVDTSIAGVVASMVGCAVVAELPSMVVASFLASSLGACLSESLCIESVFGCEWP